MIKQVFLVLCFASALTLSVSESSKSDSLQPHAVESFDVGYIQVCMNHREKKKRQVSTIKVGLI